MNDLKFAARQLLKNPGFTTVSVLTLAVAIGATTAIYSAVQTTILDPLPVKHADRLMVIESFNTRRSLLRAGISPPTIRELRQQNNVFADLAIFDAMLVKYRGGEFTEVVRGAAVSANFFGLWQIQPFLGRVFATDEERLEGNKVVILSHAFWRTRLDGNPQIVGKTIEFDGGWIGAPYERYTVIGVMPRHFVFPQPDIFYWIPRADPPGENREGRNYAAFARLSSGATPTQAQGILDVLAARDIASGPTTSEGWSMRLRSAKELFSDEITRQKLWILFAVIGLVWLIACSNVANLLLARAEARQHEMVVRAALGAGRGRLMRQLLTESLLLALAGGVCGLILTDWGIEALSTFLGGIRLRPLAMNAAVFASALALSVITGLAFGLAPAWRTSRPRLAETLKQTGASVTKSAGGRKLLRGLIVMEVAFALVILAGAGLMIRSVISVLRVDVGYNPQNLLMAVAVPSPETAKDVPTYSAFIKRLGDRYAQLPGVQFVGIRTVSGARSYTADGDDRAIPVRHEGSGLADRNLFTALHVPLLEGRFLNRSDGDWRAVVVNRTLANAFWPGEKAVGKRLRPAPGSGGRSTGEPVDVLERTLEVVGVVGDVRLDDYETTPQPTLYRPAEDGYRSLHYDRFYVRTAVDATSLIRPIHAAINATEPGITHRTIEVVSDELYRSTQGRRFFTLYLALYAGVGLMLATLGLYGLMVYSVQRRKREFGIRLALGSTPQEILKLVMGDGIKLTLLGLAVGLAGALLGARFLQSQLYGVTPHDPATFIIVVPLLLLAAGMASFIPGRRAAQVDPMQALREE